MQALLDIVRFELLLQGRSPLLAGLAVLYALVHLLTIAQAGIHLTDNPLLTFNSPYLLARTALVLGVLNPLPAIFFVAYAVTRDEERQTAEAFYTLPVPATTFLLGRFVGGLACVLLMAAAAALGLAAGAWTPWLSRDQVAPTAWLPITGTFFLILVPNLFLSSAVSFAIAARTRSLALAFVGAPAVMVLALVVNNLARPEAMSEPPAWLTWLDPSGLLAVESHVRLWSVAELNSRFPFAALAVNRFVWTALSCVAVAYGVVGSRLELASPAGHRRSTLARWWSTLDLRLAPAPSGAWLWSRVVFSERVAGLVAFRSQLGMDLRAIFVSPLSAIVVVLAAIAVTSEAVSIPAALMNLPQRPLTGLMLGIFRFGLLQFVLMLTVFYAGALVHREREHRLADIVGACPDPDWVMVVSKTMALGLAVTCLLAVAAACAIGRQLASGHRPLDLAVYAEGLFLYDGVYFGMLAVLAIVIQVISPGKWSGMVATVVTYALLLALPDLGFEDLLYGFRLPFVVYSDLNGFGHYRAQTLSLSAYWAAVCLLLVAAAHLLYPRGAAVSAPDRLRLARTRLTTAWVLTAATAAVTCAALGGWIFYNTHVLNPYTTAASRLAARAEYERRFGVYRSQPGPSLASIDMNVELYPRERRLNTRGRADLRYDRGPDLHEVVVSADPRLVFTSLQLAGASLVEQDVALGFYRFRLNTSLHAGSALSLEWQAARTNAGFVNSGDDTEIVGNGTFVELRGLMPLPAYDEDRELRDNGDRQRHGLPAAARLPALGDPAWRHTIGLGVSRRADLHLIVGTSSDQDAISSGRLLREWRSGDRHYFEYASEQPVWPTMPLVSARFVVSRATWNGVSLEVYHDARHAWNVPVMLETARKGLAYFSREFAPYPLTSFRIMEYPRYRTAAQAFPGAVAYAESAGFLADRRAWASLDYATAHELAHQWWGGFAYGARMQGRQMLNETLAQYSTLMLFKEYDDPRWLRELLATTLDNYLNGRSREPIAEQPLMRTEDQGNISYNKGALVLFALQDLVGADKVHAALRAYLARFGMRPAPFPTSLDLIDELRAVVGPEHQALLSDLFEKIVFYDVRVTRATVREHASQYEVAMDVTARQLEADGLGNEREVPLDTWFDVVVFPESSRPRTERTPLYKAKHRLTSGRQRIVVAVPQRPAAAAVDPFHLMIDRTPADNVTGVIRDAGAPTR